MPSNSNTVYQKPNRFLQVAIGLMIALALSSIPTAVAEDNTGFVMDLRPLKERLTTFGLFKKCQFGLRHLALALTLTAGGLQYANHSHAKHLITDAHRIIGSPSILTTELARLDKAQHPRRIREFLQGAFLDPRADATTAFFLAMGSSSPELQAEIISSLSARELRRIWIFSGFESEQNPANPAVLQAIAAKTSQLMNNASQSESAFRDNVFALWAIPFKYWSADAISKYTAQGPRLANLVRTKAATEHLSPYGAHPYVIDSLNAAPEKSFAHRASKGEFIYSPWEYSATMMKNLEQTKQFRALAGLPPLDITMVRNTLVETPIQWRVGINEAPLAKFELLKDIESEELHLPLLSEKTLAVLDQVGPAAFPYFNHFADKLPQTTEQDQHRYNRFAIGWAAELSKHGPRKDLMGALGQILKNPHVRWDAPEAVSILKKLQRWAVDYPPQDEPAKQSIFLREADYSAVLRQVESMLAPSAGSGR